MATSCRISQQQNDITMLRLKSFSYRNSPSVCSRRRHLAARRTTQRNNANAGGGRRLALSSVVSLSCTDSHCKDRRFFPRTRLIDKFPITDRSPAPGRRLGVASLMVGDVMDYRTGTWGKAPHVGEAESEVVSPALAHYRYKIATSVAIRIH